MAASAPLILATGALATTLAVLSLRHPLPPPLPAPPPEPAPKVDPCPFRAGARTEQTVSLGAAARAALPIRWIRPGSPGASSTNRARGCGRTAWAGPPTTGG
jgi:hypothetical protein